jgi:translocator protein
MAEQLSQHPSSGTAERRSGRTGADIARVVTVAVLAVLQPASSLLATLLPGEQPSTGAISDRYAHLLTPAGYAFAVWGLIYLASLGLAVYQALPAQHARAVHRVTGWWVAGAFASSTVWVPIFVSESLLAAQVVIVALVAFLAVALARMTTLGPASGAAEQWLLRLPVSGYLGWATVATVAGTGTTARWAGVDLTDAFASLLAVVAVLVLALLAGVVAWTVLAATGFAALLAWGLAAVAVGSTSPAVSVAAVVAALVPWVVIVVRAARSSEPRAVLLG